MLPYWYEPFEVNGRKYQNVAYGHLIYTLGDYHASPRRSQEEQCTLFPEGNQPDASAEPHDQPGRVPAVKPSALLLSHLRHRGRKNPP